MTSEAKAAVNDFMNKSGHHDTTVHEKIAPGITHENVGLKLKGNSSLMSANMSGNGKVPFRLRFDRFECEVAAILNQRFYGFQRLTFSSNRI